MKDLPPCHNCITLPICQNKHQKTGSTGGCVDLAKKCSIILDWLNLQDTSLKDVPHSSRQCGKTAFAEFQGQRIINLIKFMGWQLRIGDTDETKEEEKKKLRDQTTI